MIRPLIKNKISVIVRLLEEGKTWNQEKCQMWLGVYVGESGVFSYKMLIK
jgi:hypothetical protein